VSQNELQTAAKVTAVGGMPEEGAAIQNYVRISEGDELVRRQDIPDFITDTLVEICQEYPEISDEARNGMQGFANRLLEKLKAQSNSVEGGTE